jgi:replicative DNA helicase
MAFLNTDYLELHICSCLCVYPSLANHIDTNYISNNAFKQIISFIRNTHPKVETIRHTLEAMEKGSVGICEFHHLDIEGIYQNIETFKLNNKTEKEIYETLQGLYDNIIRQKTDDKLIEELNKAIWLIQKGNQTEGITIAKALKYAQIEDESNTYEKIQLSLMESNLFKTGITQIDKVYLGLLKGNMMTILGGTGQMKTMISMWMCLQILITNPKFTCIYFEKEMPVIDISRRLASILYDVSLNNILEASQNESLKDGLLEKFEFMTNKYDWIQSIHKRFIMIPNTKFNNAADIYRIVDTMKPDLFCVDFLTQLAGKGKTSSDYTLSIGEQCDILKSTITDTQSFGIILSQVSEKTLEKRTNKIPLISDVEWSSVLQQYSAYIYSAFFPSKYYSEVTVNPTYFYLICSKARHGLYVDIPLLANPASCTFKTPDVIEEINIMKWLHDYRQPKRYGKD